MNATYVNLSTKIKQSEIKQNIVILKQKLIIQKIKQCYVKKRSHTKLKEKFTLLPKNIHRKKNKYRI